MWQEPQEPLPRRTSHVLGKHGRVLPPVLCSSLGFCHRPLLQRPPSHSPRAGSTLQRHNVQQKDTSSKCISSGNATHAPLPGEENIWLNITSPDSQHTLLVWGGKSGRKYSLRHLHLLTLFPYVWKEKHYNSPMVTSDAECKSY